MNSSASEDDGPNKTSSTPSESRQLDRVEREVLKEANELLESLEHTHRGDLALHLYSTHLLKSVLKAANRKKFALETNTFIKTQIKDNWTSWPNPSTVIDPRTNSLFEDDVMHQGASRSLETGEISPAGLEHASSMVRAELNAVWQRSLAAMSSNAGITLDVDKMDVPPAIAHSIMDKMDLFFKGLHTTVAAPNKLKLSQLANSSQLQISEAQKTRDPVSMNRKIKLDYRDIIIRGCQMQEDMYEIYMKSLELYRDIPSKYRKEEFKLPKRELRKYSSRSRRVTEGSLIRKHDSRAGFVNAGKLLKQSGLDFETRTKLRLLLQKEADRSKDRKTFLWVKGYRKEQDEESGKDQDYSVDDLYVPLRRSVSREVRKSFGENEV
ncbi:Rrn9p [Lachancea thermotolerans CBS 6340]|uniref:KLTH0C04202p n=1 Tax=Lachancea thermotolerans (strain ATCC 56472 / CBS 6340 / NRRL Y-8284) TaxID=559295 RepID=C5DDV9_LACTC|nr:KLTH0C04202p [Lachancea thermotolerans CBS 6340]CAR21970.1 KLTH0C04202p [Lachancea thermotolerans CBS 6340]